MMEDAGVVLGEDRNAAPSSSLPVNAFNISIPDSEVSIRINPIRLIPSMILFGDLTGSSMDSSQAQYFMADHESHKALSQIEFSKNCLVVRLDDKPVENALQHVEGMIYAIFNASKALVDGVKIPKETSNYLSDRLVTINHDSNSEKHIDWWRRCAVADIQLSELLNATTKFQSSSPPLANSTNAKNCRQIEQDEIKNHATQNGKLASNHNQLEDLSMGILHAVRLQYEDMLYKSKASLAYFAKGPLSRARAEAHELAVDKLDNRQLSSLLRSLILPLTALDKKYRESIPHVIRDLPIESPDKPKTQKPKRNKVKSAKLGKNGLFKDESNSIAAWWRSESESWQDHNVTEAGTQEIAKNAMLNDLRGREMQLQIILILEVMALESTSSIIKEECDGEDEKMALERPAKRQKKVQPLGILLDLLIDRLSIWQSVALEGLHSKSKWKGNDVSLEHDDAVDMLKQFCVGVVIPFYGARLPEVSTMLCLKLGGPVEEPSIRPSTSDRNSGKDNTQLKSDNKQRQEIRPNQARKPLQRILTDQVTSVARKAPTLSRSQTEPKPPRMTRENSATNLSLISANKAVAAKRYSQREVDLRSTASNAEAKLKRKQQMETELHGAIETLRKPNARVAVRELLEDAEKRSVAMPRPRKLPITQRRDASQHVHIEATPRKGTKNLTQSLSKCTPSKSRHEPAVDAIPASSNPKMPSTDQRPMYHRDNTDLYQQTPSSKQRLFGSDVQETPARRQSQSANILSTPLPRFKLT